MQYSIVKYARRHNFDTNEDDVEILSERPPSAKADVEVKTKHEQLHIHDDGEATSDTPKLGDSKTHPLNEEIPKQLPIAEMGEIMDTAGTIAKPEYVASICMPAIANPSIRNAAPTITKRKRDESDNESDDGYMTENDTHVEGKRSSIGARSKKLDECGRRRFLEDDEWTGSVSKHSVVCRGCTLTLKLNNKRTYDRKNWMSHRKKCPGISKEMTVRTGVAVGKHSVSSTVSEIDSNL